MTAGKEPPHQRSTRHPDTDLTIGSKRQAEGITTRPSTPDHDTTSGQGIPVTRRGTTKRARIRGPNGVQPPSLEMNNYNMWPTAVIPDVEEGAVGQSQAQAAQMRDRRALPLRRTETFVFEASDCDSIEDFGVNSDDHEAVSPIDRESTRFSEAIALEETDSFVEPDVVVPDAALTSSDDMSTTEAIPPPLPSPSSHTSESGTSLTQRESQPVSVWPVQWPKETDLVLNADQKAKRLTHQNVLVRSVITESFHILLGDLLFVNAYPDALEVIGFIQNALFTAAERIPAAKEVHRRLVLDLVYLSKITPLPRARISLLRREVKIQCDKAVEAYFTSGMTVEEIAISAQRQLLDYAYIYPQGNRGAVMRTRPYRNPLIIRVIRDMYFVGGRGSFSTTLSSRFATFEDSDGSIHLEVPKPMVALVATAYYAALADWRSGSSKPCEFTANAYHDVYLGHISTLQHIENTRSQGFHRMMADIYERASGVVNPGMEQALNVAMVDLDEMDG
ncbi:hypothetical protein BGW80DRAFT_1260950 [Lactifluus volemus]|nr:hypothetical protein BGW80DRAFT_1260950 [Lactifluus volemus]